MSIRRRTVLTAAAILLMGSSIQVHAQDVEDDGTFSQSGLRLGGFTLYSDIETGLGFDDNVLAQQTNEIDDTYVFLNPELRLNSNWSRHELNLSFRNENDWYNEQSSEDRHDWAAGIEGRLDVNYATSIHGRAVYSSLTEKRGDANVPGNAAAPTEYDQFDGFVEVRHTINRLSFALGGGASTYDFDDVGAIGGGVIDNDDRDRTVLLGRLEAYYEVSPDTRFFARGVINDREYDQQPPLVPVTRDSDGYELDAGIRFDLTRLIEGEVYAGYLTQDYDALPDIDGFSYGANIDWYLTTLTTVSADVSRSVEETNTLGASGYLHTSATLSVRHELLRQLNVTGDIQFVNNDYEGSVREEDMWSAGIGAEYQLNRYLSAGANYRFQNRDSNLIGADYDRNRAQISLIGRF